MLDAHSGCLKYTSVISPAKSTCLKGPKICDGHGSTTFLYKQTAVTILRGRCIVVEEVKARPKAHQTSFRSFEARHNAIRWKCRNSGGTKDKTVRAALRQIMTGQEP